MGVVEPAVSDVKVIAKHKSDGTILTSRTDSKGSYKYVYNFSHIDILLFCA